MQCSIELEKLAFVESTIDVGLVVMICFMCICAKDKIANINNTENDEDRLIDGTNKTLSRDVLG